MRWCLLSGPNSNCFAPMFPAKPIRVFFSSPSWLGSPLSDKSSFPLLRPAGLDLYALIFYLNPLPSYTCLPDPSLRSYCRASHFSTTWIPLPQGSSHLVSDTPGGPAPSPPSIASIEVESGSSLFPTPLVVVRQQVQPSLALKGVALLVDAPLSLAVGFFISALFSHISSYLISSVLHPLCIIASGRDAPVPNRS